MKERYRQRVELPATTEDNVRCSILLMRTRLLAQPESVSQVENGAREVYPEFCRDPSQSQPPPVMPNKAIYAPDINLRGAPFHAGLTPPDRSPRNGFESRLVEYFQALQGVLLPAN